MPMHLYELLTCTDLFFKFLSPLSIVSISGYFLHIHLQNMRAVNNERDRTDSNAFKQHHEKGEVSVSAIKLDR